MRPLRGFTMIEMLTAIAIVGILAGLSAIALTRLKSRGNFAGGRGEIAPRLEPGEGNGGKAGQDADNGDRRQHFDHGEAAERTHRRGGLARRKPPSKFLESGREHICAAGRKAATFCALRYTLGVGGPAESALTLLPPGAMTRGLPAVFFCEGGGTGRRAGLRSLWAKPVRVRLPP